MMKYRVVSRKAPKAETVKYYPLLTGGQLVLRERVIERIEKRCTLSSSDVKAVLDALEFELIDCLQQGNSVRLGDLGSFRVTLRSEGVDQADAVTSASIKGTHVVFTPSSKIRRALSVPLKTVSFQRVDEKAAPAADAQP